MSKHIRNTTTRAVSSLNIRKKIQRQYIRHTIVSIEREFRAPVISYEFFFLLFAPHYTIARIHKEYRRVDSSDRAHDASCTAHLVRPARRPTRINNVKLSKPFSWSDGFIRFCNLLPQLPALIDAAIYISQSHSRRRYSRPEAQRDTPFRRACLWRVQYKYNSRPW